MPAIQIKTGEQMSALVDALANQVLHAGFFFSLLRDLTSALESEPQVHAQSPAMWGLVVTSLRDAVLVRLTRAYDQERRALSLRNWLETIRANLHLFERDHFEQRLAGNPFVESLAASSRVPESEMLEADILSVCASDPLVKRLLRLRNNAASHVAANWVVRGADPFQSNALYPSEYETLLQRATQIVNRYSDLFRASTYSDQITGADDYTFVLSAVREKIARQDELRGDAYFA